MRPSLPAGRIPRSALPLHRQLGEPLRGAIGRRALREGAWLLSERELAERYGVSRITVRQVLGSLAAEGYIQRRRGTRIICTPRPTTCPSSWRSRASGATAIGCRRA